jgi:hypothetical protein
MPPSYQVRSVKYGWKTQSFFRKYSHNNSCHRAVHLGSIPQRINILNQQSHEHLAI